MPHNALELSCGPSSCDAACFCKSFSWRDLPAQSPVSFSESLGSSAQEPRVPSTSAERYEGHSTLMDEARLRELPQVHGVG